MKHGSLFSGIGGFDLAAEWMGWENIFHCEWNPFGQKILKHYWPNAISYENICTTDFTPHRGNIDIISGGFPCQPFSQAGSRKGTDDSRYLWPEMLRCIREVRPRWIVGENVYGLVNWDGGVVLDTVCADLENEGFKVLPIVLPAAGVNAPHQRNRIWFVAHAINNRHNTNRRKVSKEDRVQGINRQEMGSREFDGADISRDASNPSSNGHTQRHKDTRGEERCSEKGGMQQSSGVGWQWDVADSLRIRQQYGETWECSKEKSQSHDKQFKRRSKLCGENFEMFPTVPPICTGDDGISDRLDGITFPKWRNESIKGGGNAIVPQVVYQIFKTIEENEANRIAGGVV